MPRFLMKIADVTGGCLRRIWWRKPSSPQVRIFDYD